MNDFPLLIEFVPGTTLFREPDFAPKLPIVQNGPPGTSIVFPDGFAAGGDALAHAWSKDDPGAAHGVFDPCRRPQGVAPRLIVGRSYGPRR